MEDKDNKIDRRDFLKTVGAAGLGSVLTPAKAKADPNAADKTKEAEFPKVPKRKLGNTGVEVPVLALGMIFDVADRQIVLRKALEWGITYWDTAHGYTGGNSELGIGKFLEKNPEVRKRLFLISKASGADTLTDIESRLQTSLERMSTGYIDLYYGVHGLDDPAQLTNELKNWAESAKKRKLIKFFGFSTHENMAKCLTAAAKAGWIDAVMTTYNFRVMQDDEMQAAVEACYKAGVGLVAMKTQAQEVKTEEDKRLTEHFLKRGFTEGQAKIKAVLEDERISSACTSRGNLAHLYENVAAVLDPQAVCQGNLQRLLCRLQ